jgi:thioredoxin reductase (NADPH)
MSTKDTQHSRMFLSLEPAEIERVRRFGEVRSYGAGEALFKVGDVGHGLCVILSGHVDLTRHLESGALKTFLTQSAGAVMGEMAQLVGRPTLVDGHAQGAVEALIIPPDRVRALLVAEAELGDRIMIALMMRRASMIEMGTGGPVIVGSPQNGDVLRLEGFLARNGHPCQRLNPETDPEAKALIERFHVDPSELPIVLCPSGQLLRNPSETELARSVALDAHGFVLTGADAAAGRHHLETSRRGVFAVGDVRCGSVKRVAAAVGEGAQVVPALHAFLAPTDHEPTVAAKP